MHNALLAIAFLAVPALTADDKQVVRELQTKELNVTPAREGKAGEPTEIKSADDLAKNAVLKDAADDVKKLVNFDTEKLLVFAWAGSGQDKIAVTDETKDGKTVLTLTYTPGLTRDLRQHVKLFAVPKGAEIKK
ncbi:hypothetical protein GobsT_07210 [Gemmata obscuriglobus]|uniref:Uncharacterized protein n=1 Tax=Gemmata obscuriglobus TaxID=114 RepID=A0A2Z3H7D2_9BACT|nr:hypothetical protein [Gemmata obscuriglobus]AWM40741.1 hypothetical protein C1280_29650 [Gemmata obscuriglobus]QEG25986.1 hypothetical protein GobsT_07210 [Gemmata obscuriglobus]VTS00239.1 unnamed protein product [Gemmata obscuriglobus UQM 2246]